MQNDVSQGFRLAPQQRRLWSVQTSDPGSYVVQGSLLIDGPLDQERLTAALQQTVDRHEILRTSLQHLPGMSLPVQVIAEQHTAQIAVHDLSTTPTEHQAAALSALKLELRRQPLTPVDGSLVRLVLVTHGPQRHLLLISFPALCGDSATLEQLVHEICTAYAGDAPTVPSEELLQYADFAEWQYTLLEDDSTTAGDAPWSQHDLTALFTAPLPFESRSGESTFTPQTVAVPLGPETAAHLSAYAQQRGTTVQLCVLAGWHALLWRLTQQSAGIVGVRYDGRSYDDLQGALGLFAKYIPVHVAIDARDSFNTLLARVAEAVDATAEWQTSFFWDRFASASGYESSAYCPHIFEFQPLPQRYVAGATTFTLTHDESCIDRFELKLTCFEQADQLAIAVQYNRARFAPESIERIASLFATQLHHALVQPELPIGDLPLLSPDERRLLLHEFNATQVQYPATLTFPQLFEQQAAQTPDSIAVSLSEQRLSYAALNARANQWARRLRRLRVEPEMCVAVYMERTPELLAAILGVFKAGGVYLPLDPSYPQAQLAAVLADSQAGVLITQERLRSRLPEQSPALICVEQELTALDDELTENMRPLSQPAQAAYVIYTSGSTGQPKGVVVAHDSLVNYLCWVNQQLLDGVECRLPVVTRLTFDASLKQLFAPLIRGAEVWLLPDEAIDDPETLLRTLAERTHVGINCVPSLWATLLDIASERQLEQLDTALTHLFVGGEQLSPALVERTRAALPNLQIWNLYGPTETTANASAGRISSASEITIGRPIANTAIYVLDMRLEPVPIGVAGEIYVGGSSLARGYLNRPALTADAFVPNPFAVADSAGSRRLQGGSDTLGSDDRLPFAGQPGTRLYRTGDLARYRPDGSIEFLGRRDTQVKLRGLRIELGAIEAVLSRHPAVRESVVIVRDDTLVAYLLASGPASDLRDLRGFLQDHLPGYMVPALIVTLDALPRTPTGKIDRAALPTPDATRSALAAEFVAPRTPIEVALATIWCEVLDLEQVGIHDNFFQLGGHSLLATRLVSRVRKVFRVELPLRALFEVNTIAQLAQALVAYETRPGQTEQIAVLLERIRTMSAEDVTKTLQAKRPTDRQ